MWHAIVEILTFLTFIFGDISKETENKKTYDNFDNLKKTFFLKKAAIIAIQIRTVANIFQ